MEVELTTQAEEDLEDLPIKMFDRYEKVIDRLEKWPEVSGMKTGKATPASVLETIGSFSMWKTTSGESWWTVSLTARTYTRTEEP